MLQGASGGDKWPTLQSSHGPPASTSASPVPTEKGTPAAQRKVEKTPAAGNATQANRTGRVWRGSSANGASHTQTANSQQTKTWQKSKPWHQPQQWQQIVSRQTLLNRQSATKIIPLATPVWNKITRHCEKSRQRPTQKRKHSSLGTQLCDQWKGVEIPSGRGASRTERFCVDQKLPKK